jgi:hypothetical protein
VPLVPESALRHFALQCAERLTAASNPAVQEILENVRHHVAGTATLDDLVALQARTHPAVAAGGVHGLPRCSTFAAAMLAAWHAAGREPLVAAWWSAEFAARHDAFAVVGECAATWQWPDDRGEPWRADWRAAYFAKAHPAVNVAALADARRRQADLLRSILPAPFGVPIRSEVYFGEASGGRVPVYCMTCGCLRADTTPGVIFDARGVACRSCRAPVARCVH